MLFSMQSGRPFALYFGPGLYAAGMLAFLRRVCCVFPWCYCCTLQTACGGLWVFPTGYGREMIFRRSDIGRLDNARPDVAQFDIARFDIAR